MKQVARFILWLMGWKVDMNLPREKERCVLMASPHTSNWDFLMVRLGFWVMEVPMRVAIKNDWTKFPFGLVVKPLGGLGIDRSPKQPGESRKGQVDAMAELFDQHERISLVIAAEGTRKLRSQWKMGYYWVATKAKVPILCGYLDYGKKVMGIGPIVLYPQGNPEEELKPIMEFYKPILGKHPDQFSVDERYI